MDMDGLRYGWTPFVSVSYYHLISKKAGNNILLVRWDQHETEVMNRLHGYFADNAFVDVTLWCRGRCYKAHRLILSACCDYFEHLLLQQPHCSAGPVAVMLEGMEPGELAYILDLIYKGEARVTAGELPRFLERAKALGIRLLKSAKLRIHAAELGSDAGRDPQRTASAAAKDQKARRQHGEAPAAAPVAPQLQQPAADPAPLPGTVLALPPTNAVAPEDARSGFPTPAESQRPCSAPRPPEHAGRERRGKVYLCEQCGKVFSQRRNYRYHVSLHSGTREFAAECPECGKMFRNRSYLSSHLKIHRNRREYACGDCGRRFNQRVAYSAHARMHAGHRPHACTACGKAFSRKALLRQHVRTHTGEKPFTCQVCEKQFSDRSNMIVHARSHLGVKPFTCHHCNRSFSRKGHLQKHVVTHLQMSESATAQNSTSPPNTPKFKRDRSDHNVLRLTSVITRSSNYMGNTSVIRGVCRGSVNT